MTPKKLISLMKDDRLLGVSILEFQAELETGLRILEDVPVNFPSNVYNKNTKTWRLEIDNRWLAMEICEKLANMPQTKYYIKEVTLKREFHNLA